MKWKSAQTHLPKIGRRIVAVYWDGSGADTLLVSNYGFIPGDDGEEQAINEVSFRKKYSVWLYLPDDFLLSFERDAP